MALPRRTDRTFCLPTEIRRGARTVRPEGAEGMSEDQAQFKSPVRMPRRSHLRGLTGALIPRSRVARALVGTLLLLMGLAGIAALVVYGLIAAGIVTANLATPYIERAIADRLDGRYVVRIGSTAVETMQTGSTVVIARDISLSEPDGTLVASAPSAEVELEGSLLTLSPKAKRFDLIGAEVVVRIGAKGDVAVAAGKGARMLSTGAAPPEPDRASRPQTTPAPAATPAPAGPAHRPSHTEPACSSHTGVCRAEAGAAPTAPVADLGGDPLVMKAFADWLNAPRTERLRWRRLVRHRPQGRLAGGAERGHRPHHHLRQHFGPAGSHRRWRGGTDIHLAAAPWPGHDGRHHRPGAEW